MIEKNLRIGPGPVEVGRLDDGVGDALQPGEEDHDVRAEAGPDADDGDRERGRCSGRSAS